ncbi:hypothetical protein LguiA_001606 [Lonicera macranthoides]
MTEVVSELELALTVQERRDYSMAEEILMTVRLLTAKRLRILLQWLSILLQKTRWLSMLVRSSEHQDKKVGTTIHFGRTKCTKKLQVFFSVTPMTPWPISRNFKLFNLLNVPRIYRASNNTVHHATEVAPTDALTAPIDTEYVPKSKGTESVDTEAAPNDRQAINIEPIAVPSVQLDELREITDNFGTKSLIYEGPYRRLYNGILKSGRASCIKKLVLNERSDQEFLTQVSMASKLKHENVVELLGYCVDGDLRVLAYEYASKGSLHDVLHGRKGIKGAQPGPVLSWSQRVKIAVGAAKGLEYLHEKSDPHIVHCYVRSSNVLLFEDDVAKIADMDLSNQVPNMKKHLSSIDALYCAPE